MQGSFVSPWSATGSTSYAAQQGEGTTAHHIDSRPVAADLRAEASRSRISPKPFAAIAATLLLRRAVSSIPRGRGRRFCRKTARRASPFANVASLEINTKDMVHKNADEFCVAILGDLHIDPRKMDDYYTGRDHIKPIIQEARQKDVGVALVSLGDLGESKSVRPKETDELFAGTTECHELAAEFLSSFDVPYEVIGGNHDLEGIDEFSTDEANLAAFLRIHGKPAPQFARLIAEKTLLVGLGSTVFRSAQYTSHEVTVDDQQLQWFENLVASCPATDGWKIFVFTHAPPIGSGLRVLQENHVVNGCCWLNHSGGASTTKYIELVRKHRCIKGWFSGHFHLGQDYEDSITFPTIPRELGPYPNRGSCVFAQTSVMRAGTSRDTRQQSRLLRGNKDGFEILTINHADGGSLRLDASITYSDCLHEVGVYRHDHEELSQNSKFIKVYSPTEGDEHYVQYDEGEEVVDVFNGARVSGNTLGWWHMSCGRVLGIYDGRLVEYEPSTLAPLGLVVGQDELEGKLIYVISSGADECKIDFDKREGIEGADCADSEPLEQAVLLVDEDNSITVVQPNEDGSYWRKIVRNKMIRMKESRRVKAAKAFALKASPDDEPRVVSSWGPYTSIVGTAKKTGVAGLTTQAKIAKAWDQLGGGRLAAWREMADEIERVFNRLDKDGDGNIGASELRKAVKELDKSADEGTIMDMVQLADTDSDGKVSLEEFARLMLFQRIRTKVTNVQPA
eukprot:TRINITY_DN25694_c0_g1_i1.p1 TRINITY_DN25694_c0_g1~~TRINITY_DN25694_c0_g1_i1.p1  ORF type:complete len:736 (-),score=134.89 TRINITY_DN25694_c0_g1_i1:285-2492(-)